MANLKKICYLDVRYLGVRNKLFNKQKQQPEVFCEKKFLEISQNSREKTCVGVSFLIKLQA